MKTVAITIHFNKVYGGELEIATAWDDAEEAREWCLISMKHRPELYLRNVDKELHTTKGIIALQWDRHPLSEALPASEVEF